MRLLLLLFLTLNLLNAQKLALLIGNSNYTHLDKLSSPSKDIPALAQKLRDDMDFEVTELYDLDEKAMKKAIKDFKRKLQQNPNAIALFYYSGHGSQAYGESYLIPIDGDTRDEADVEADGVKVETIAMKMAHARTKANILFLDACRDVPTGTMGNGTKGLGQVKNRPSGSLIVYSTSKNTTAKDDRLFNRVVLEKLATNVPLVTLANDISYSVDQKTNGSQVPEVFAKSLPTLCLSGSCNTQPTVVEKIVYRDRVVESTPQPVRPTTVSHSTYGITTIDGLMYQNQPFIKRYTWEGAKEYCQNLTLGGYNDWRLPTKLELNKISNVKIYDKKFLNDWDAWFDKNEKSLLYNSKEEHHFIRKVFLENMPKYSDFWASSVSYSGTIKFFWKTNFRLGQGGYFIEEMGGYALCVR